MKPCLGAVLVGLVGLALLATGAAGQIADPADAVFMLAILNQDAAGYKQRGYGTAFFVSADGVALTNSHIVSAVKRDPEHTPLLAVVDNEFYSVQVVCASRLPYDPTKTNDIGITATRDVAEIRVVPATLPLDSISYKFSTGEELTLATAHRGALPRFPFLTISGHPRLGSHVRVIGYGHISPFPRKWTAKGMISSLGSADDGTETFDIEFSNPAQPGNSGSPVLDEHQQVVGIWTWFFMDRHNLGTAQSNDVLRRPCS